MDVKAEVLLKNVAKDCDLETISQVLRQAVAEHLDFDRHPDDLTINAALSEELLSWAFGPVKQFPVYGISDLHMGDAGARDNFAYGDREKQFLGFLDMVEDTGGRLIICGDLFELWQSNISKVLRKREWLLDRLARMGAVYVLGNHDADLRYFINSGWLAHPFFKTMCPDHSEMIGGRWFDFIHGHQADAYCAGDTPGLGRITAIYSGLREDRNGGPMLDKYRTVEARSLGRMERLVSVWNWLRRKPDRFTEINRNLRDLGFRADVLVCGHTHRPGHIGNWHFNTGTWAEHVNSFVCINENGTAGVFDWVDGRAMPNDTELPI